MLIHVSLSLNIFDALTYNYQGEEDRLQTGQRVIVPIGNRLAAGWVIEKNIRYTGKVKNIIGTVKDNYTPGKPFIDFIRSVSGIYFSSMGTLLDSSLSPKHKSVNNLYLESDGKREKFKNLSLNRLQQLSKDGPIEFFYKTGDDEQDEIITPESAISHPGEIKNKYLLGFSRFEAYKEIIADSLSRNRSVLITVPDNLTAAFFKENLQDIDIYNSEIKLNEREKLWQDYAGKGKAGVIVGGLSAALLPIQNLGVIISGRAGSSTYKRSFYSRYNIHLLSQLRAAHFNIPLVEGFSTYTVQSFQNRSQLFIEDKRQECDRDIAVAVHMLKRKVKGIPGELVELLKSYFLENKKILIVLNKKIASNFLFCEKCKKIHKCPSCDSFIKVEEEFDIRCSRCGFEKKAFTHCTKCSEPLALIEDIGISSVKKIIKSQVIETGLMSLSAEGLKEDHIHSVLKRIHASKIVIATPIILNPFFKDIFDAVIYLRPESHFNMEDYDAAEKIFSIVSELKELVKGSGTLDIFSTFHFHYALKLVNEEEKFFERELKYREWFHLPPFCNVYHIKVKNKELRKLAKEMRNIYNQFKGSLNIKRVYLTTRQKVRGVYKGTMEAHAQPADILQSGLLKKRDVAVDLELI